MRLILALLLCTSFCSAYSQNWLTAGNSGTGASDFIGTTDNQPLLFRTNNTQRFSLTNDGKAVIRPGAPAYDAALTVRSVSGSVASK